MTGVWMAVVMISMPTAWNMASKVVVNCESVARRHFIAQADDQPGRTSRHPQPKRRGAAVKYLIRDRDAEFPPLFDEIRAQAGFQVVLSGIRVPRMNSVMERWVQTCRHELLDRTLIGNQGRMLHALHEYETHYNSHRAHLAMEQAAPPRAVPAPITNRQHITDLNIRRHDRLDGIVHEYQHVA